MRIYLITHLFYIITNVIYFTSYFTIKYINPSRFSLTLTMLTQDHLNDLLSDVMHKKNNRAIPEFEGYSPTEMHILIRDPFGIQSPVQLQTLSDEEYREIPLLNQVHYLGQLISDAGELKLTQRGYLPPRIVKEIYEKDFIKDEFVESGITKLRKESDSITIILTAILITLSGIAKKRNNKLSLTRQGKILLSDKQQLLKTLFTSFGQKFNWAYFDGYGENQIGQLGFGFSIILLNKFGAEKQTDTFYGVKYFAAFPDLITPSLEPSYGTLEEYTRRCYSLRTFERFLDYFGLILIQQEKQPKAPTMISKTALFDKLITIKPHQQISK